MNSVNKQNIEKCLNTLNNQVSEMLDNLELFENSKPSDEYENSYCFSIKYKFENTEYSNCMTFINNSEMYDYLVYLMENQESSDNSKNSKKFEFFLYSKDSKKYEFCELSILSEDYETFENWINYQLEMFQYLG